MGHKTKIITTKWIMKMGACIDAVEWAKPRMGKGRPVGECIGLMRRADWLLWLLLKSGAVDKREIVRLACIAGRTALRYVPGGEYLPCRAFAAAEAWVKNPSATAAKRAWAAGRMAWGAMAVGTMTRTIETRPLEWAAGAVSWAAGVVARSAKRDTKGDAAEAVEGAAWADAHNKMCALIRDGLRVTRVSGGN